MKKWPKYAAAAVLLCVVAIYLFVPQKAVKGECRIHYVSKNSIECTERLSESEIEQIADLLEGATCSRWKNWIGPHPADEDTVYILGLDDRGGCTFTLVGSVDRFTANDHELRDGKELWQAILEILP